MKRLTALLLLLLFLAYTGSTGLFFHTHIINGKTVVHSHFYLVKDTTNSTPYSTGGAAQHRHSKAELTLIDLLSNWNSEQQFPGTEIPSINPPLIDVITPVGYDYCCHHQTPSQFLRGPPVA